eukprot:102074-Rhodomonas_salina.2
MADSADSEAPSSTCLLSKHGRDVYAVSRRTEELCCRDRHGKSRWTPRRSQRRRPAQDDPANTSLSFHACQPSDNKLHARDSILQSLIGRERVQVGWKTIPTELAC